jgi:nitrogen fixation NifU-like protein
MSAAVKGKTLDDVRSTIATFKHLMTVTPEPSADEDKSEGELRTLGELAALAGVARFPVRIKCATLAWNTLAQGLQEIA